MGVTEFVFEIRYLKEGAYLDKFDFVTRYDVWPLRLLATKYFKWIDAGQLPLSDFIWVGLLNKYILLLKSLRVDLDFYNFIFKRSKHQNAAKCDWFDRAREQKMKK